MAHWLTYEDSKYFALCYGCGAKVEYSYDVDYYQDGPIEYCSPMNPNAEDTGSETYCPKCSLAAAVA